MPYEGAEGSSMSIHEASLPDYYLARDNSNALNGLQPRQKAPGDHPWLVRLSWLASMQQQPNQTFVCQAIP